VLFLREKAGGRREEEMEKENQKQTKQKRKIANLDDLTVFETDNARI
jgi:hypothetical protein